MARSGRMIRLVPALTGLVCALFTPAALAEARISNVGSANPFAAPTIETPGINSPAPPPAPESHTQTASLYPQSPSANPRQALTCQQAIRGAEKIMGIPAHMLHAVALVESGKMVDAAGTQGREVSAWPWTVMAEGRGRYLNSKQEAIKEVKALQARGIRNIDVGCMQINLGYHGKAFQSLDEAFEPMNNVAYAAAFLTRLNRERHSWHQAVAYYHSSDRVRRTRYQNKVISTWKRLERAAISAQSQSAPPTFQPVNANSAAPWAIRSYRDQQRAEIYARNKALQAY